MRLSMHPAKIPPSFGSFSTNSTLLHHRTAAARRLPPCELPPPQGLQPTPVSHPMPPPNPDFPYAAESSSADPAISLIRPRHIATHRVSSDTTDNKKREAQSPPLVSRTVVLLRNHQAWQPENQLREYNTKHQSENDTEYKGPYTLDYRRHIYPQTLVHRPS